MLGAVTYLTCLLRVKQTFNGQKQSLLPKLYQTTQDKIS